MLVDNAETVGVVEHNRDLQRPPLLCSLRFDLTAGEISSLADFRRGYDATTDGPPCPSGFYQPLPPTVVECLRDLVGRGLDGRVETV